MPTAPIDPHRPQFDGIPLRPLPGLGTNESELVRGRLFSDEEGGEPMDLKGNYPGLRSFTNHGGGKPGQSAFENRGSGSFGMEDYRSEPTGPSRAIRDPEPAHLAQLAPEDPSQPSWVDFAANRAENDKIGIRNQGRIRDAEVEKQKVAEANASDVATRRQEFELTSLQRRQALINAFEERTGQPFSDKALAEELKRKYEDSEKDSTLEKIFKMFDQEQEDLNALAPGADDVAAKALIRRHYKELRDRFQNVRTNRAVQLSNQPDTPGTNQALQDYLGISSGGGP